RGDLERARPVLAGELLVVLPLQPLHALAAAVDVADEVRGQRTAGVRAQRLLGGEDAGEAGLAHRGHRLLRRPRWDALLEVDEPALGRAELVDGVEVVDPLAELLHEDAGDPR